MATVTDWSTTTFADLGPIYPWVGSEWVMAWVGIAAWIVWHIIQAKRENRAYDEEVKRFGDAESLRKIVDKEDPGNP
jgi:hypothetical protein